MASRDSIAADRAHLLHPLHHPSSYASARTWVSAQGAVVTDDRGREYIDGLAGLWCVNVGHGRRELADAAHAQMTTLAYHSTYAGSTNPRAIELAEKLSTLTYPSINTFFFTSGGAEATETSIKTARFYWKAQGKNDKVKVIARRRAYHGLTLAAMSATGLPAFWPMFEPRVSVRQRRCGGLDRDRGRQPARRRHSARGRRQRRRVHCGAGAGRRRRDRASP
jgi:putrescine---pyruvate transaminase